MTSAPRGWRNTTHDWSASVDHDHLARIRSDPSAFAPGGPMHLVLEVLAYAVDEAAYGDGPRAVVALHPDGSISVADNGRGTDTRVDDEGRTVRKPIMATQDLRFFESHSPPVLSDGHPRRGISVVAALSSWLVHTNRRPEGAWTQRYEQGIPVTDLDAIESDGTTGTTVHFSPNPSLVVGPGLDPIELGRLIETAARAGNLTVELRANVAQ